TRDEFRGRNDFVNEADAIRFLRADHFSGENELKRATFPDQPWQTLGPATARDHSQFHFGLTKLRVFYSNPDRASHCCFASAAKRETVNRGDHGLAEIFDQIEDILPKRTRLLRFDCADLCELADIGAGDECFFAGSS